MSREEYTPLSCLCASTSSSSSSPITRRKYFHHLNITTLIHINNRMVMKVKKMSFGVRIDDLIEVVKLAHEIQLHFFHAPKEYKAISDE